MQEVIEREIQLPGMTAFIGSSQWSGAVDWVCPESKHVVCQRLSEGHAPLLLATRQSGLREVYPRVRSLGFMPSSGCITMHPIGQPLRTLNCWFDRAYFEEATGIESSQWSNIAGPFLPMTNGFVETLMNRIHLELADPDFGAEQFVEAAGTMIALEMARLAQARVGKTLEHTRQTGGLAPWQLRRVRERIAAAPELGYPGTQELAQLCGISGSHLMRMFRISTGWPLHRFIANERVQAARDMLAEDRVSIKGIAARLGFSSAAHFTNAFRRHEHMAPTEFRRRVRSHGIASGASLQ